MEDIEFCEGGRFSGGIAGWSGYCGSHKAYLVPDGIGDVCIVGELGDFALDDRYGLRSTW